MGDKKERKQGKKSKNDAFNARTKKALQQEKLKKIQLSAAVSTALKQLRPAQRRKIEQEIKKQLEKEKDEVLKMKDAIAAEKKRNEREQNALMAKFEKEKNVYRKDLDALNAEKKALSEQMEDIAALRKDLESKNRQYAAELNKDR